MKDEGLRIAWVSIAGTGTPEFGVVPWNEAPPVRPALKDAAEAPTG